VPDDASWLDGVVVPDDLSELAGDVEAYHRELRLAARRRRVARITGTSAWQRFALPVGVGLCSLTLASAVFVILTLGHPHGPVGPPRAPVASGTSLPSAGQVGGVLPDVTLRTSVGPMSSQDIRPALVALVPLHCDCLDALRALAAQAAEVRVPLVVVAPTNLDAEVDAVPGAVHSGSAQAVFDLHGALRMGLQILHPVGSLAAAREEIDRATVGRVGEPDLDAMRCVGNAPGRGDVREVGHQSWPNIISHWSRVRGRNT